MFLIPSLIFHLVTTDLKASENSSAPQPLWEGLTEDDMINNIFYYLKLFSKDIDKRELDNYTQYIRKTITPYVTKGNILGVLNGAYFWITFKLKDLFRDVEDPNSTATLDYEEELVKSYSEYLKPEEVDDLLNRTTSLWESTIKHHNDAVQERKKKI